MPVKEKIRCWEYFSCDNRQCSAHGDEQKPCWLHDNTPCASKFGQDLKDIAIVCASCRVFEQSDDAEAIKAFVRKHFHAMVTREHMAKQRNLAFSEALSSMLEVVDKLCKGDPAARIEVSSDNILVRKLEEGINQLASSIADSVAESHELAIGICEHYDVLNRIAAGDLGARASESSSNELIAQLGVLINKGATSLVSTIRQLEKTDEELSFAYHQMRDIVDFLPDATFVVDREGKVIAWNKAIEEMTGFLKQDMLGKGEQVYSVPFYGKPRPVLLDFLDKDLSSITHQYSHVKRVGDKLFAEAHVPALGERSDIYLWVTAAPLIDMNGNRIGAVESVRDITDYRKAEVDRANLEAQLRQSQKMEAIGLLAGGIAHDFNNLLTAIIGYASLLQLKVGDHPDLHHYIDQINVSTSRATKLTQDLLAFSRKRVLNPEPMDLNFVITRMKGLLSRLLTEDIEFSINFECDTPMAVIDKGMIEQVLMNLVANARDALPHGGVVTIRTSITEETATLPGAGLRAGTRYAIISVSDNGVGMDAETSEKIFEPFFTTKETGKGTGLGLSTAYGIISQHEGTIFVDSKPGQGTTFRVFLPLLDQPLPEPQELPETFTTFATGGSELILLAEDNAETRCVTEEILTTAGYRVITAANGEEALNCYRELGAEIKLIVTDVIMPIKNGRELYEEVKALAPDARCLFTSGYTADIIHTKGKIEKEFDFLPKPSRPNELLSRVREILDRA